MKLQKETFNQLLKTYNKFIIVNEFFKDYEYYVINDKVFAFDIDETFGITKDELLSKLNLTTKYVRFEYEKATEVDMLRIISGDKYINWELEN